MKKAEGMGGVVLIIFTSTASSQLFDSGTKGQLNIAHMASSYCKNFKYLPETL